MPRKTLQPASKVNSEQQTQLIHQTSQISVQHAGPIPDPETLGLYGQVDPSFPERLVSAMERQEKHRQDLERMNLERNCANNMELIALERERMKHEYHHQQVGQIFGLLVSFMAFGVAGMVAIQGHDAVAATIGGVTAVSIATVFVTGRLLNKSSQNIEKQVNQVSQ